MLGQNNDHGSVSIGGSLLVTSTASDHLNDGDRTAGRRHTFLTFHGLIHGFDFLRSAQPTRDTVAFGAAARAAGAMAANTSTVEFVGCHPSRREAEKLLMTSSKAFCFVLSVSSIPIQEPLLGES